MNNCNPFTRLGRDVIDQILVFVGGGQYRYIVADKEFESSYLRVFRGKKETYGRNAVASISCAEIAALEADEWWLCGHSAYYWSDESQDAKDTICSMAARHGQLDVLKWCRVNGFPWHKRYDKDLFRYDFPEEWKCNIWADQTCEGAARNGHLNVMIWARKQGCPWDARTCAAAALGGHLRVLMWAHENGCQWSEETCTAAAFAGHLAVLKYARNQLCPWNRRTCQMACENGHFAVLKWAYENGCEWSSSNACEDAARHGNLEMMQYAIQNGFHVTESAYLAAARHNQVHILEWGLQRGDDVARNSVCEAAARQGNLPVIKWAHENGHDGYSKICAAAAAHGHLHVLMWVFENGLDWDATACSEAASGGWLHVLKWLTAHECPWSSDMYEVATRAACKSTSVNLSLLKWVLSSENPDEKTFQIDRCIDLCFESEKDEVLSVLLEGCYGRDTKKQDDVREEARRRDLDRREKYKVSIAEEDPNWCDLYYIDENSDTPGIFYHDFDSGNGDY